MVRPALRSRSLRKVFRKTPGNSTTVHHKAKKPQQAKCAVTGQKLKGVPRAAPAKLKNMSKSSKKPSRPYGGQLSSSAMRTVMKAKARQ